MIVKFRWGRAGDAPCESDTGRPAARWRARTRLSKWPSVMCLSWGLCGAAHAQAPDSPQDRPSTTLPEVRVEGRANPPRPRASGTNS
jgi:hypothetical protein